MAALSSIQKAELFNDIRASGVDISAHKLLNTKQAAALLGISEHTIERRRTIGQPILPAVKIARRVSYRLSDVLKLLQPEGVRHES